MKKFIYTFLAIFFATITLLPAQNQNPCAGKAIFQHTINGNSASFFSVAANPPLIHSWSFGDGTGSTLSNPVHVYPAPGTYQVKHYVYGDSLNYHCVDSSIKSIVIGGVNICDSLRPKFSWYRDTFNQNRIQFINQTQPNAPPSTILYLWSFGDGTSSTEKNPAHTYSSPGQYYVCLTVQYATINCTQQYCVMVTAGAACNLQPNFTSAPDPAHPLRIKFTNQTLVPTNTAQVRWSFGDGSTSSEWSPTHIYTQPGNYNVCLTVKTNDSCVKEICKPITVRACTIEPNFTWVTDTVYPLRGVQFINQTPIADSNVVSVKWSFGNGTGSTAWSPFHQYEKAGTYRVCLKIEFYGGCVKEICKTIVILEPIICERLSDFTYRPSVNEPNVFYFTANVNNSTLKYVWTFGDGTGAFIPDARHLFNKPGKYVVCLTVYRGENCASTTCKEITVGPLNCTQTFVKFEYQRLNNIGNAIKFTAVGNQPIISQRWTIQMLNSSNQIVINTNNPTYTFTDTGLYKVCLRAITGNGCIKEYCEVIRIQNVPQQCTVQITPNPATTQITFKTELQQAGPVIASIIDASGIRRAVFYFPGVQGINSFTVPVANLPVGFYSLEVIAGGRICKGRFQKIN